MSRSQPMQYNSLDFDAAHTQCAHHGKCLRPEILVRVLDTLRALLFFTVATLYEYSLAMSKERLDNRGAAVASY